MRGVGRAGGGNAGVKGAGILWEVAKSWWGKKSALLGDLLPVTSCAKRKSASNLRSGGFFQL